MRPKKITFCDTVVKNSLWEEGDREKSGRKPGGKKMQKKNKKNIKKSPGGKKVNYTGVDPKNGFFAKLENLIIGKLGN